MTEYQLVQLIQASTSQLVMLIGQIIAINFAMVVAIYYFLNRAGMALKISAFLLYTLGSIMFLVFAVRESGILLVAREALSPQGSGQLSGVGQYLVAFGDHPLSGLLTFLVNTTFWAMWIAVLYLLFFWKRRETPNN